MKKLASFVLFLILFSFSHAQKTGPVAYNTESNILYYEKAKVLNPYMDSLCRLDIYYPKNQKNLTTVVWFHGGGLTSGNKYIPEELKDKGLVVIGVSYRLYPRVKCPVCIEDAAAAVAWTFNNIHKYGGDPNKIFVSGHSAGGYLTMMVGLDKHWLAPYNIDPDRIAALVPFSGQAVTHFTIRKDRNISEKQPIIDEYAPLYHVRGNAPPLILITGDRELEIYGRYEENAYLMRMMKENGHKSTYLYELDGYNHPDMAAPAFHILLNHIAEITKVKKN